MVFHVNLWHTIVRRRQQEATVEADFERTRIEVAVPVRPFSFFAKAKMPLADDGSFVASPFQNRRDGFDSRLNDRRSVGRRDPGSFFTKRVAASEEGVACWRAG